MINDGLTGSYRIQQHLRLLGKVRGHQPVPGAAPLEADTWAWWKVGKAGKAGKSIMNGHLNEISMIYWLVVWNISYWE